MPTDAALLQRYVEEGNEEAFAELVRRHLDGVYSWALRRVGYDVHLAEDVAQEVFVALAREAKSLARHPVLTGWLYLTTRNAAANVVRRERRRKHREQEAHIMQDMLSKGPAEADWKAVAPVLEEAIDQLNKADRVAILLRFIDRRTFAEIGEALQLTDEAARKRVDRAIDKLRTLIGRHGVASSSAALALALANHAVVAAPAGLAVTVTHASMTWATASATPAAGLFSFMSSTKLTSAAVATVLALIMGAGCYEMFELRGAEQSLRTENEKSAALVSRLRTGAQKTQAVTDDVTELRKTVEAERASDEAAKAKRTAELRTAPEPAAWDPVKQGQAFMTRHPEVKQALIAWNTAGQINRWGGFYKSEKLTPEQIERLQSLLRERSNFNPSLGADGKLLTLRAGNNLPPEEIDRSIRELLGDDGFQRFVTFGEQSPARDYTAKIASVLCFTDTPLTSNQADQMVQIIAGARSPQTAALSRGFDWDAVAAKAQGVLSPPQFAALSALRAQDEFEQAMSGTGNRTNK